MQGVDQGRYQGDLAACRQYAGSVNVQQEQMNAAIGSAIFSAAIMAIAGGSARQIDRSASIGGLSGMTRQGNRALSKQEVILGNCLAARGYRVLDGTANVSFVQGAAPMQAAGSAAPVGAAGPMPPQPQASSIVQLPIPIMPPPPKPTGKDAYVAERLARDMKCTNAETLASLIGRGPGFESYSLACTNGEMLIVRCEFGNCRALK